MAADNSATGATREAETSAERTKFSTGRSTRFSTAGHPDLPKAYGAQASETDKRVGWRSGVED